MGFKNPLQSLNVAHTIHLPHASEDGNWVEITTQLEFWDRKCLEGS